MSFKKSPLQVINLAQMPLDVVKKRGTLPKGKTDKKTPEMSDLMKRLIYPSTHRLDPPPVKLKEVGEMGGDAVAVTKGVYQNVVSGVARRGAAADRGQGGGGPMGAATYLVKCGLLVALVKWTYDLGVWGNSRQTLHLAQVMGGKVTSVFDQTRYNWDKYFKKDTTGSSKSSSGLTGKKLTVTDEELRSGWSYKLLRKDQHEVGFLGSSGRLSPAVSQHDPLGDVDADVDGPLVSPAE